MDHPILPLPPPEPPAPENPPEKAPPKPHTCNDSAMSNFRALMMKMAIESSPSKSLTPTQTLILEDKLRQCFPYLRAPDHPPYAWMITTAIKQLNEEGGSSEEAISECIMNDNHDLPWAHSTLLKHHLVKLCEKREIVQTRDGLYVLNDRIASVPRVSIPSNPREFFDSTASPSCSLSISLASDSSSDSLYGGSSRKARNTRKGRQQKGSARRGNIHLKRKRKVQRRPPKKGRWKEEISSDEDTEDELLDIMLEEGMAVIRAENQLNEQKVTVEELYQSEDINEDMNAETKAMELQEGTVDTEEQNQSKQLEVNEEEHRDNQREKNTGEENSLLCVSNQLQEQKLLEELHPLEEAKQGGNQPEMLEVSPSIPREEDSRHEIIQTNEDIEVIEVKDCDLEEQITGNPAQKEQEMMEESHQSPKMENEDKQEDMDEKKRDWGCEKDVDEGEHQPMQLDVMLEEENPLLETNDQLENANLVNDTKFQEMVDEGLNEHGCQESRGKEISHSPKNSSFLDEEQQSIQTEAEIVQDQNTESIEKGSSDEVEEISSPFQQNNEVSSEEEEQQELPFSEDTKQEQLSQRQLRPRVPKTEPGKATNFLNTQEHRIPQVVLSLEATRGVVTRGMAAATALDEQAPQQRKKRLKSQVGEISRMPRRSTRLSLGQSKKRVSRRRT
nr:pre-mRNA-splicing factor CWC22 homolog [Ipomoea batatas]